MQSLPEEFLDFPHQRFREILAITYFEAEANISQFVLNVGVEEFREFVIVMFRLCESRRDLTLSTLLAKSEEDQKGYFVKLAHACLEQRPKGYDPSHIIEEWGMRIEKSPNAIGPILRMLKFVNASVEFVTWADRNLVQALRTHNLGAISIFGNILYSARPSAFFAHISEALGGSDDVGVVAATELLLSVDGAVFVTELLGRRSLERTFKLMTQRLLEERSITGREDWWKQMCRAASDRQLAVLLSMSLQINTALAPRVLGIQRQVSIPSISSMLNAALECTSGMFLIADSVSELIENSTGQKALLSCDEGFYIDVGFVEEKIAKPSFESIGRSVYSDWIEASRDQISILRSHGTITLEEAEARYGRLELVSMEDFIRGAGRDIEAASDAIRDKNVVETRKFMEERMFWQKERLVSFLRTVGQEMVGGLSAGAKGVS